MKKSFQTIVISGFIFLTIGLGGAYIGYNYLTSWGKTKVILKNPEVINFPKGTGLKALSLTLESQGVISNKILFQAQVRLNRAFHKFKAGKYKFKDQASPNEIIEIISSGKDFKEILLSLTFPEGFTSKQIIARLAAKKIGTISSLNKLIRNKAFLNEQGIHSKSIEGYLYPTTYYYFERLPTGKEAIKMMVEEFFKRLPNNYLKKIKSKGLTLDKAVNFASLIERETLLDEERSLVSEVIWKRLKNGAPIGIDAALIYGIPNFDGDIKWKDLKNKNNLYNTRIHKGLPPTPICSPAVASLKAVLTPSNKGYYYYVKMVGETKKHHFSRSLKEHNRYVKKLVRESKRKR